MSAIGQPENALSAPGLVIGINDACVLRAEQIRMVFADHTALGHDENGTPFDAYLSDDGDAKINYGSTSYTGTWYIDPKGKLCGRLEEFFITDTMCFTVYGNASGSPGEGQYVLIRKQQTINVRVVRAATSLR